MKSPALEHRSHNYPARFGGRVPSKIKMLKTVNPDTIAGIRLIADPSIVAAAGQTYDCWVNSLGAVAVIFPNDVKLGVKPDEFEVVAYHPCPHKKFHANVRVNRLEDSGRFSADITIKCEECGEPFRFLGLPAGVDLDGAAVSVDGTEARLAIGTAETVANIIDGNCPVGFTVRKS